MLKPQDIAVALAILIKKDKPWRQSDIAAEISISVSEVNSAMKRLIKASLLTAPLEDKKPAPNIHALKEFLVYGLKYVFPAELGERTRGIPTSYAAPIFKNKIHYLENDIPVWPDVNGTVRGYTLKPLYGKAAQIKNQELYNLVTLLDAIRGGMSRERNIAIKLLEEKLGDYKTTQKKY